MYTNMFGTILPQVHRKKVVVCVVDYLRWHMLQCIYQCIMPKRYSLVHLTTCRAILALKCILMHFKAHVQVSLKIPKHTGVCTLQAVE